MKNQFFTPMGRVLPLIALLALGLSATMAGAAQRSGKEVVETVCIACHGTGKDGAPMIGDRAAWSQRASKGMDKLTANAITGLRNMPAHGGQAQLTDVEMSRAVAYMVSGGKAVDTKKAYSAPHSHSGEQIVQERCQECHATGKNGSPKIGDVEAWKPRLANGVNRLVDSAISGHNSMPARGGMSNLSDAEMRMAVEFMLSKLGGAKQ
ncbi:MAG: cytochrome c5 family protein [Proteobacteria bacterium]|nr:cytochrome c5 family protein [Pseudomonadota bacterium]